MHARVTLFEIDTLRVNQDALLERFQQTVMPELERQDGYQVVTVNLPLGDLTSAQARGIADIARRFVGDNIRTTVEQNLVLRYVSEADLPDLYAALRDIGLHEPGANTIADITACPGTDTCKLGIAS